MQFYKSMALNTQHFKYTSRVTASSPTQSPVSPTAIHDFKNNCLKLLIEDLPKFLIVN